jgi:hypothetical protein
VFSDFRHGIFNRNTIPTLAAAIPEKRFGVADSQEPTGRRSSYQREWQTEHVAGRLTASTAIHKASRPRHTMIPLVSLAVEATICVHDPYDPAVELLTTAVPRELAVLVPISVPLHHPRPKGNPPGIYRTLIWKNGSKAYVAA